MASGKTHAVVGALASGTIAISAISDLSILFVSLGCLLGIIVTPDLDVKESSIYSHYAVRRIGESLGKNFGSLLYWIWKIFWYPYSRIIPKHRHWTSHFPIIGTLGRLLYLGLFAIPVLYFFHNSYVYLFNQFVGFTVCGLFVSDTIHWIMDGFPVYS